MNNYTFCNAEADIGPVAQQQHGDREDVAPCERISVLDHYES